ncbi:hypothetical protein FPV67DRAFT_1666736 [Lyophyllum atratum]|nr:hypothetical protein FPV67DRAFT_1666736 [Lyophyllum atratum]
MTALAAPDFEYLEFLQIQKYINAACVAIWVYEFIRSIGLEVSLVWKEAWNIPKGLYLLARYFTFVMLVLLNYYNQTDCVMYQKLLTWTVNVSMLIAEVIFALRTWAVWDRSRRMAIFLTSFFLVIWISTFAIIGFWTSRTVYPSAPQELLSCRDIYNEEEQWLFRSVNFVLIVVFYSVTLVLTSIRAYQYFSGNLEMGLMRIVHFDGLIYYFFLFGVSVKVLILNVVTKTLMSHAGVVSGLQPTVCTLMACRMLLHLRQEGKRTRQLGQLGQLASQAYTSGFTVQLDTLVFRHEDMSPDTEVPNDYRGKLPS